MKTVILQKTKAWSKMFLSGVQVLGLLKKKKKKRQLCIIVGFFLWWEEQHHKSESVPRADPKEQWKARLGFIHFLLLKEKNENKWQRFLISAMIWESCT